MKLDQLVHFVEAAKHEHIGKAAKIIHISPGAISHSIAALEEEFGKDLFIKRGKNIFLTEHGKLLAEKAAALLSNVNDMQTALSSDKLELRGHFRIAGANVISASILMPAWAKLQNSNPSITGEVFTRRSAEVLSGVIQNEYDLGLCFSPQPHVEIEAKVVRTGQLLIAVRKGHPLEKSPPKHWLKEISKYPAALPKSFHGIDVCEKLPEFEKFGINVKKLSCLIDSYDLTCELVANSNTWSLVPDLIFEQDKRIKPLTCPTGWSAKYNISAVWARRSMLPRAMASLVDSIAKQR